MAAPHWMLLDRVLRVAPGPEGEEAESAAAAAHDGFITRIAVPPEVTVITASQSVHPDPRYPDMYPYVLVANPAGILVHFSVSPFNGVQFSVPPLSANLVLLTGFHRKLDLDADEMGATAEELFPREGTDPVICNIESIGVGVAEIIGVNEAVASDIVIAELMVDKRSLSARIIYCLPDSQWLDKVRDYPLVDHDRDWVPAGVVVHDDRFWWFDLSWGILSCEVSPDEMEQLIFHDLPDGRALDASRQDIHNHRCITASGNALRYVEIIPEGEAAAMVSMWTAVPVLNGDGQQVNIVWEMTYEMSFTEIWNDNSYTATGLPQRVPVITAVCPPNPNLVYFSLQQEQRLFGVDVPHHRVVEFVDNYNLVMPTPMPPSSRYVLAWLMHPDEDAEATESEEDESVEAEEDDSSDTIESQGSYSPEAEEDDLPETEEDDSPEIMEVEQDYLPETEEDDSPEAMEAEEDYIQETMEADEDLPEAEEDDSPEAMEAEEDDSSEAIESQGSYSPEAEDDSPEAKEDDFPETMEAEEDDSTEVAEAEEDYLPEAEEDDSPKTMEAEEDDSTEVAEAEEDYLPETEEEVSPEATEAEEDDSPETMEAAEDESSEAIESKGSSYSPEAEEDDSSEAIESKGSYSPEAQEDDSSEAIEYKGSYSPEAEEDDSPETEEDDLLESMEAEEDDSPEAMEAEEDYLPETEEDDSSEAMEAEEDDSIETMETEDDDLPEAEEDDSTDDDATGDSSA